jgi:hypothetical protein
MKEHRVSFRADATCGRIDVNEVYAVQKSRAQRSALAPGSGVRSGRLVGPLRVELTRSKFIANDRQFSRFSIPRGLPSAVSELSDPSKPPRREV